MEVADGSCEWVVRVVRVAEYAVPVSQDAASAGIQWDPSLRRLVHRAVDKNVGIVRMRLLSVYWSST